MLRAPKWLAAALIISVLPHQLRTDLGVRQLPARFNVDLLVKNRQIGYHSLY